MLNFEILLNDWNLDLSQMETGSAVATFDGFACPIWIGKNNVSLMVSKEEYISI